MVMYMLNVQQDFACHGWNNMIFLGKEASPIIVAEISCNHGGDLERAKYTIAQAHASGADIVKIQTYTADEMCIDKEYTIKGTKWNGQNLYELYKKNKTPYEWIPELFNFARNVSIPLFSSVFSLKGLEVLEQAGCPAYKIAGFESDDIHLIHGVSSTGKQVVCSVNEHTPHKDIREWVDVMLYCVNKYPTEINELSFRRMSQLMNDYKNIGYSDHCVSMHSAAHAAAMGACMIERHFSLELTGDDKEVSLNPAQFKLYVKGIRRAAAMYHGDPSSSETRQFMRSVYATKLIKAGEALTKQNTATFRPRIGISAHQYMNILGDTVSRDIEAGEPITWSDVNYDRR